MSAISNGLALHGGFLPYDATFLVFSDYSRNALRMSALIPARAIHVFTHDSIGLGEDGPTHQPVEHLASLRYIPNNDVWRPCDAVESAVAWQHAIERRDGPTCLVFSRQNLAHQPRSDAAARRHRARRLRAARPGRRRVRRDPDRHRLGSGAGDAGRATRSRPKASRARVVSMPSHQRLRPPAGRMARGACCRRGCRRRVAIEAGVTDFWRKYVGLDGAVVGIDSFGASAPIDALYKHFGITVDAVVAAARRIG